MKKISQREARRLKKRVEELEQLHAQQRRRWMILGEYLNEHIGERLVVTKINAVK